MTGIPNASTGEYLQRAEAAFMQGQFGAAAGLFRQLAEETPRDCRVLRRMGQLSLLENRSDSAIDWLLRCERAGGDVMEPLAEAYYRARRLPEAASRYACLGRNALAAHLAGFGRQEPCRLQPGPAATAVEFLAHDPLPLLRVQINGVEEALFLIDTGAWDTVVDASLTVRAGLPVGGLDRVGCAGGRDAVIAYSRLASLALGEFEISTVPVQIMDLDAALPGFFEPHGVDGILGLGVLSLFAMEMDMQAGCLRLSRSCFPDALPGACWLGNGRQLLAWGEINRRPNLWFVDTGMMGFDCLVPSSTARSAALGATESVVGYGGGGVLDLQTAQVEQLALGAYQKQRAQAVISDGFMLERCYGFRIGGMLALEFIKSTKLAIDFFSMRIGIQPAAAPLRAEC